MKSERVEQNDKLQNRTEKRPSKWKLQNLASGNHVCGAQTIEMSEITS